MCPPGHAFLRDLPTGRHAGRPLQIPMQHPSTSGNRAGTESRPTGQGSLVQRELSPGGRLRDCPRLLDTSGMLSAACPTHPLRPLAQMLRPAPLARAVDGASLSSRRGRCPHRPVAWHPGRTVGAGLCPRPLLPGLREVSIEFVGADPCVGPDMVLRRNQSAPAR